MKTKINLLDTSFILHSDQESPYIHELVAYIESQLETIRNDVDCVDPLKASIMASLLITHELFMLRDDAQKERSRTVSTAKRLTMELEEAINS